MADVASALVQEPGVESVLFNPLAFGRNAVRSAVAAALALPGRALTAAGDLQRTGDQYDPAPAVDAAMMTMGGTAFGAPKGAVGAGPSIRAYHGSPYDFERFDMSKIGTGEGAQAYGHGLYFAENPTVAADYRRVLTNQQNLSNASVGVDREALKYINAHGGVDAAKAAVDAEMKQWVGNQRAMEQLQVLRDAIREPNKGRMYEVNINAAPEHFLDWDKPLAQHPQEIRDIMRSQGYGEPQLVVPQHSTIGYAAGQGLKNPAETSRLAEAGIPGIKYLDQGSRRLTDQEIHQHIASAQRSIDQLQPDKHLGPASAIIETQNNRIASLRDMLGRPQTSNYVVFNDKLIDILRKYQIAGIAPPAALVAAAQQGSGQQQ